MSGMVGAVKSSNGSVGSTLFKVEKTILSFKLVPYEINNDVLFSPYRIAK